MRIPHFKEQKDLVLARYSADGYLYRARVESIYQHSITVSFICYYYRLFLFESLNNLCQVFYVDYGNFETVDFDSLFEWDLLCNTFPFQAVSCRLTSVHCLPGTSANAIFEFIYNNYLSKMCKIRVL